MKLSELIKRLEYLKSRYGDCEVYSGGEDYPGPVDGARYITSHSANGYTPENTVKIDGGI